MCPEEPLKVGNSHVLVAALHEICNTTNYMGLWTCLDHAGEVAHRRCTWRKCTVHAQEEKFCQRSRSRFHGFDADWIRYVKLLPRVWRVVVWAQSAVGTCKVKRVTDASIIAVYDAWRMGISMLWKSRCVRPHRSEEEDEDICNGCHCMIHVRPVQNHKQINQHT